jgi:iron complex transport system ATP-binding protein
LVVMAAGRVVAQGDCDDPQLHAALIHVFQQAIRIETVGGRFMPVPHLGD